MAAGMRIEPPPSLACAAPTAGADDAPVRSPAVSGQFYPGDPGKLRVLQRRLAVGVHQVANPDRQAVHDGNLGIRRQGAESSFEINRLFDNLLDLGGDAKGAWMPNADISETREALVVKVELPGVDAERLSLSVLGGHVIVRGEKPKLSFGDGAEMLSGEREFGPFRRVIQLGVPVNTRQAKSVLHNGLLRITFPKVPNRRGEEVPIEVHSI